MAEKKTVWVPRSVMADQSLWARCRAMARAQGITWQVWVQAALKAALEAK